MGWGKGMVLRVKEQWVGKADDGKNADRYAWNKYHHVTAAMILQ
jgi:hypothetical protein